MSNFKYGDKVLVNDAGIRFRKRIFVLESNGKTFCIKDGITLKEFNDDMRKGAWWDNCKAIPEKPYTEKQEEWVKEHKIKVGDTVIATRDWDSKEHGFHINMGRAITKQKIKVLDIDPDYIECREAPYNYCYPYFVLEKIKPAYRPFTMEELNEHRDKWVKRQDIEISGQKAVIELNEERVYFGNNRWISYRSLLEDYVFDDGSVCGVQL